MPHPPDAPESTLTLEQESPQLLDKPRCEVTLVDGTDFDLTPLSLQQLEDLHWEQEVAFAEAIKRSTKGSVARTDTISLAYETVCTILGEISRREGHADFAMGMDPRYSQMVLERLAAFGPRDETEPLDLFEIGFGAGLLLEVAANAGYGVGGLEVAPPLLAQAKERLPIAHHHHLVLGDFIKSDAIDALAGRCRVVYWNDVFEHVPVDEIEDYLARIHRMLVPGGELISITPNWHMRPSDVTADYQPPRTTAMGFHLKEYTLCEIVGLLKAAGFQNVATPSFISKRRIAHRACSNWTPLKAILEPWLEWLPYPAAVQCCRRFGFNCTIARK
ncbi:MAG: class I SAM-dependent methyltransferase [Planctomycetota bacterium]